MLREFRHTLFLMLQVGVVLSGATALLIWPSSWPAIAVCVAGSLVAAVACERVARAYLRKSLGRLRRAAEEAGQGRGGETLTAQPGQDFYKLVNSINTVAQRLAGAASEQQRLNEQLRKSEKLAFLGELAATVAHEVNNPLDGVSNCARILRRNLDDPVRARQMLDLIDGGLERIERITRRLLTLARGQALRTGPVRLTEVVQNAIEAVRSRVEPLGVRIRFDASDSSDWALADTALLEQVFVNLIQNAADSMPNGGEIAIRLGRGGTDGEATADRPELAQALYAEIADTGVGIAPELLPRIFEPFFTTKKDGKGTGLGLAIASRIVDAHRGVIDVRPRQPSGCVFTVLLPPLPASEAPRESPVVDRTRGLEPIA